MSAFEGMTPEQRQNYWLLYKAKQGMFSVVKAAKEHEDFKEVYEKWRGKEVDDAAFLPLLRKYVFCPKFEGEPIPAWPLRKGRR